MLQHPLSRKVISLFLLHTLAVIPSTWAFQGKSGQYARNEKLQEPFKSTIRWRESRSVGNNSQLIMTESFPDLHWWETFQDPILNGYIQDALNANQDLSIAIAKIQEANLLARQQLGAELPQMNLGPSFTRQQNSKNLTVPSQQLLSSSGPKLFAPGATNNIYNAPLKVSYELDIWGKNILKIKAAKKLAEASTSDSRNVMLQVTSDIATAYLNLAKTDYLIDLQNQLLLDHKSTLELLKVKYDGGLIDYTQVDQAESDLLAQENQLLSYQKARSTFESQLAVLTGKSPGLADQLMHTPFENLPIPKSIPVGIPSTLLERRPDVLAALARLENAGLNVKIAKRDLLPTFSVTGQFGYASTKLSNIASWQSHLASILGGMSADLFTGGQKKAQIKIRQIQLKEQMASYQKAVLSAFQDVENSLGNMKSDYEQHQNNSQSEALMLEQMDIRKEHLAQGLISDIDLNRAHQSWLQSQQKMAESKIAVLIDSISLYKSLGGGY